MTSVLLVDTIKNSLDSADAVEFAGPVKYPSGIIQHVQHTYETQTSITSTSDTTLFSGTITPKFSTSKIYLNLLIFADHANYYTGRIKVFRGSTLLKGSGAGTESISVRTGSFNTANGEAYIAHPWTWRYMDSPATTSQVTYTVKANTGNASYATAINRSVQRVQTANDDAAYITTLDLYEVAQ